MKPSYVIFIFLNFQKESSRSFNKEAIHFACQILIIFFAPSRWRYGVSFHPSEPITKLITKMTVPSIVIDFKNPIFHKFTRQVVIGQFLNRLRCEICRFLCVKILYLPSSFHFSAKYSFLGQHLSRRHYQPTYQPPEGVLSIL